MKSVKLAFYARLALVLHAIVLIMLLMYLGRTIFIPLFFAFLVSTLLYPLANRLERRKIPRGISTAIVLLIFILFVGTFVYFFSTQLIHFAKDLPQLENKFTAKLQDIQNWIAKKYHIDNSDQQTYINKSANGMINTAVNSVATTFLGLAQFLILTIFFLVFTFFILFHRRLLLNALLACFDDAHNDKVLAATLEVRNVIRSYVWGLLTEIVILLFLNFIVLMLFGIKYALLMSVLASVLNIVPYLGIYTAMAISMLIALANGSSGDALTVGIVFISVHFIDANVILPRIVGGRVQMNPFITIVAVLIGHLLWGIPGMFLFIPLTAIIRIISERADGLKPLALLIGSEKKRKDDVARTEVGNQAPNDAGG